MDTPTTPSRTAGYHSELDHIWRHLNDEMKRPGNKVWRLSENVQLQPISKQRDLHVSCDVNWPQPCLVAKQRLERPLRDQPALAGCISTNTPTEIRIVRILV